MTSGRAPGRRDRRGAGVGWRSLSALLALVLVAGACTHHGPDGSTVTASTPTDRFGSVVVGPTGSLQLGVLLSSIDPNVGVAVRRGVQLAVDYLDGTFDGKPGPLMDHPIALTTEVDPCGVDSAHDDAQALASDKNVVGVVGMSCANEAPGGADRILSDRGVLLISPANEEPGLTAQGTHQPFFLRVAYNEALDGVVAADFARRTANAQTAAVVHDEGADSVALVDAFIGRFEDKGGTVTTSPTVDVQGHGIGQVLDDIAKTPPGFMYVPGSDAGCPGVIHQGQDVSSLDAATTFGSSDDCQGSFRPTPVGAEGGAFLSTSDNSSILGGEFYGIQFVPAYEHQFDTTSVPLVAAYAFDAANILFDAMQVSATRSDDGSMVFQRSALRDAIFATDSYEGLTGPLTCTPLGDCAAPVRFAVYPAEDVAPAGPDPTAKPVFSEVLSARDLAP